MRAGWGSKGQQRQSEKITNALSRLDRVGRVIPVPVANFSVVSTQKTRGAQISFEVLSLAGIDSFVLMRNGSRDKGSAKAIHTWPVSSLKQTPQLFPIQVHFADSDEQTSGKLSYYWLKAVPVSGKTESNVFLTGPQQFDASGVPTADKLTGDFSVNQPFTPTTPPLSATTGGSANHATIAIAPFVVQYPFGTVSYSSGTITPLSDNVNYFIYCDDPTYKGGAQTYIASTLNPDVTAGKYRLYLGFVKTPIFGGGGSFGTGGGNGGCFSGNTLICTERGRIPIEKVKRDDKVLTRRGWARVGALLVHEFDGEMREMGSGELVTPGHRMYSKGDWIRAESLFPVKVEFKGRVFNLALKTKSKSDEGHCFTLGNGHVAHNLIKF